MQPKRQRVVLVGFHIVALLLLAASNSSATDTILVDGRIVTLDAQERVAEALAIRDGRIVAVGSDAEVLKLAGDRTEVIKLGGKT
ncbi:MAG: hypothetical protein WC740_15130, partial [Verrucomicrobiia bacterium]